MQLAAVVITFIPVAFIKPCWEAKMKTKVALKLCLPTGSQFFKN